MRFLLAGLRKLKLSHVSQPSHVPSPTTLVISTAFCPTSYGNKAFAVLLAIDVRLSAVVPNNEKRGRKKLAID
jgi:hypothetical protein